MGKGQAWGNKASGLLTKEGLKVWGHPTHPQDKLWTAAGPQNVCSGERESGERNARK